MSPVGGSVVIKGINFGSIQGASTVTFGGISVTPTSWSNTRIVAPVPGSLGVGFSDVAVTVNGIASNTMSFLVIPVITRDSPPSGTVGTAITLTGTSFGDSQGTSTLTFNGISVSPASWSNTSITLAVPVGAANGVIAVTINGFSTNGVQFFVLPSITSLSPKAATLGAVVTINGSGFGRTQGFGSVTFGGVSAPVQSWSDTSVTVVVPPGATTGNVIVTTGALLASGGVNFPIIAPLAIQAVTDRASNGGGWYNAPVTVSFQCSGGLPPISCPPALTVATDGANQVIQGTASDSAANVVSASVTVSLDRAAPTITVGSPASGGTVTRPVLRITGTASDSLSGIADVNCNGLSAAVAADGSFICNLTLAGGSNSIQMQAVDNAGNSAASTPLSVIFSPIAPNAVFITPATANMVVGDTRSVRLVGDQGQSVTGATWTVSDPTLLAITTSDSPQLTALSAGTATLTASFGTLSSTMTVNISAGTLPFGTPLWLAEPTPGNTINTIMRANPINDGDPDIYMIDGATALRAFAADGQQLWSVQVSDSAGAGLPTALASQIAPAASLSNRGTTAPLSPTALATLKENLRNHKIPEPWETLLALRQHIASPGTGSAAKGLTGPATLAPLAGTSASSGPLLIRQTVPDNSGGAINLVVNCQDINCVTTFTPTLTRVDNASQQQIWTHTFNDGPFLSLSALAISPDDTIYQSGVFVVSTDPVTGLEDSRAEFAAVDGATGLLKFSVPLPASHAHFTQLDAQGNVLTDTNSERATVVGPIAVMPDGSVRALVYSVQLSNTQAVNSAVCGSFVSSCDLASSDHKALQLLIVQPDGSFTFQAVKNFDFDTSGCAPLCTPDPGFATSFAPEEVIPDGLGGTLAAWTDRHQTDPFNVNSIVTTEIIRHLDSAGAVQDYDMGIELVTGLFLGTFRANSSFVLGPNNIAFGRGIGTVAFDVTTGSKLWSTPFDFPTSRTEFVAGTADGRLIATKQTAPFSDTANALELFDPFGSITQLPLNSPLTGFRYFDSSNLLALTMIGEGELLPASTTLAIDGADPWALSGGNSFTQRSPNLPKLKFDKVITFTDESGFTQTKNVPFLGIANGQSERVRISSDQSSNSLGPGIQLTLQTDQGSTGLATFADGTSLMTIHPSVNAPSIIQIEGATVSSKADNIRLVAVSGKRMIATQRFSVVSVTLRINTSGSVSVDNATRDAYIQFSGVGSDHLGPVVIPFAAGSLSGCRTAVEIVGDVTPTNYRGAVILRRNLLEASVWDQSTFLAIFPAIDDTSFPEDRDDDPRPNSHVYDLDLPGLKNAFNFSGLTRRFRQNFSEYAVLDLEQNTVHASQLFPWYSRVSCQVAAPGPQFASGIPGDNQAGPGCTKLSLDLTSNDHAGSICTQ